jgi:uncharacterized protein
MIPTPERAVRQAAQPLHAVTPAHARSRRALFLKWLRKTHGWIGLWGAVLGLLFGATGILLNHRAILKIPAAQMQESTVQLPLPQPAPPDPKAMAAWLADSLAIAQPASRVKADPARPVAWGDQAVTQPARWSGMYASPKSSVQFEYWVGNGFVTVKRSEHNVFATLSNLHKGSGMGIGWILLADTLAGSIIVLSLSGVLLWAMTTRRRTVGIAIAGVALLATTGLALQAM